MAGLAADIDLKPGGGIAILIAVIGFMDPSGMAFGAHPVPGLTAPGPVQPITRASDLVGRQAVPLFLHRIPGDVQTLEPSSGKGYQILLQRMHAKNIGDFKNAGLAVRPFGFNHELPIQAKKSAGHPVIRIGESDVFEVTQHGFVGGPVHGQIMVRTSPLLVGGLMAGGAFFAAGKGEDLFFGQVFAALVSGQINKGREENQQGGDKGNQLPAVQPVAGGSFIGLLRFRKGHLIP